MPKQSALALETESISVSQLNKLAKTLLENNMPIFWIKGEVSGLKIYNHGYFDLKDEGGKVSCVIFVKSLNAMDFTLANGQQIEVRGRATIYPQNGSYQINVERVRQVGMGELWEAYHRLLNKLKSDGLFDMQYKKSLPIFPKRIGVITSKEGAVIRDVVTTLKRRMPNIQIIVYHTAVQGMDAGMQIARAIKLANQRQEVDVLIVCRGGGSMQDLWCFNEEVVAREVFAGQIPLISAVGHETDVTIIDFVSDLRAPTPTAAAELVAKSRQEWINQVHKLEYQLSNNFYSILNQKKQELDLYHSKLKLLNPLNQLKEKIKLVKTCKSRLDNGLRQFISHQQHKLRYLASELKGNKINLAHYSMQINHLQERLHSAFNSNLIKQKKALISLERQLNLVSPTNVLSRGYAIVKNKQGNIVYSSDDVLNYERVELVFCDDQVSAIIDKKHNKQQEELI